MNYKENNQVALDTAIRTYGNLRDVEDNDNPSEVISYLTSVLGLVCSQCGKKNISWNTLKFCNFDPSVICWNCQHN